MRSRCAAKGRILTQMVVDGSKGFVSSDSHKVLLAIAEAAKAPKVNVRTALWRLAAKTGNSGGRCTRGFRRTACAYGKRSRFKCFARGESRKDHSARRSYTAINDHWIRRKAIALRSEAKDCDRERLEAGERLSYRLPARTLKPSYPWGKQNPAFRMRHGLAPLAVLSLPVLLLAQRSYTSRSLAGADENLTTDQQIVASQKRAVASPAERASSGIRSRPPTYKRSGSLPISAIWIEPQRSWTACSRGSRATTKLDAAAQQKSRWSVTHFSQVTRIFGRGIDQALA